MTDTHETHPQPNQPNRAPSWRSHPVRWISGGVAAAAVLIGAVGLGSAMADDEDDERAPAAGSPRAAEHGAKDAGTLARVLTAAGTEAEGTPTSIEAHRDGTWSVDLVTANGDELTVLVDATGTASAGRPEKADADDANEQAPAGQLTEQNLSVIVEAAFAEVTGRITEVDLGDTSAEAYSVQVVTDAGDEVEIDLSSSFDVTHVDTDQD